MRSCFVFVIIVSSFEEVQALGDIFSSRNIKEGYYKLHPYICLCLFHFLPFPTLISPMESDDEVKAVSSSPSR